MTTHGFSLFAFLHFQISHVYNITWACYICLLSTMHCTSIRWNKFNVLLNNVGMPRYFVWFIDSVFQLHSID